MFLIIEIEENEVSIHLLSGEGEKLVFFMENTYEILNGTKI